MKYIEKWVFTAVMFIAVMGLAGFQSGCNPKSSSNKVSSVGVDTVELASVALANEGKSADVQASNVAESTHPESEKTSPTENVKLHWFDYAEGYNKAKLEDKILLVDAYTDWCGWCKVMDRETYTNAEVIAALNQDFVCVKFNPEVEKTHSFGKYNLKSNELLNWIANGQPGGYPTSYFLFHPSKNDERASQAGYLPPDQFLKLLAEVKKRH